MTEAERPPGLSSILKALKGREEFPPAWLDEGMLRKFAVARPPPDNPITEKNIDRFEEETIRAASAAIRVLEDALAKWESVKDKPGTFVPRFEDYGRFHAELAGWAENILKSKAKGEALDFDSRVERLLAYSRICAAHR
ncbi:hypothetical protein L0Y65_05645 [Candidatus Micrarchaeota archaeon]|nr:hypothetical protein [Candidatus Micrarchaeota archaeon]